MSTKIKEKHLVELGFKKEESSDLVDGKPVFYYYSYGKMGLLLSNANDELIDGMFWYVEVLEYPEFKPIKDLETLKELVTVLDKIRK